MKQAIKDANDKFDTDIICELKTMRNKARISCFSTRNDSILMWSHYGDSHRGVCIEFEENRDFFRNVVYTDKRCKLDLTNAVGRLLACDYLGKKIDYHDKIYADIMLSPFCHKSKDWSYEKEVRCILSDTEFNSIGVYYKNDKEFLTMNIKRVFIGAKAEANKISDFIELAESLNIPVVYMKSSDDFYSIIPK